jgi:hypothetical protein
MREEISTNKSERLSRPPSTKKEMKPQILRIKRLEMQDRQSNSAPVIPF